MTITAVMIKDLRQRSGAGIMECKEALKESGGDTDGALDYLRKKGSSKAAKKAERSTKEGAIGGVVVGAAAALVELKCETDFVARNEKFQELTKSIATHAAKAEPVEDVDALLSQPSLDDPSKTVKDAVTEKIHELGENIVVGRIARFDMAGAGGFGLYIHGVGSIGALVEIACESQDAGGAEAFAALCRDLAMQIAASHPVAIGPDGLPEDVLAREKEIFEAQARESGKPDKIIPKIVEGRLRKYYTEACLLKQPFVKDQDKDIDTLLGEVGAELGAAVSVRRFVRFQLGE